MERIRNLIHKLNKKTVSFISDIRERKLKGRMGKDVQGILKSEAGTSEKVKDIKRKVKIQAAVAVMAVFLTVIFIFAMTAAWYTNVAKTNELNFETQSWGFDSEKITMAETNLSIAPGYSGIVPLSVDNSEGEEAVKIGVNVSKAPMLDLELQKRIFFYVDTSKTYEFIDEDTTDDVSVADETVSKVYIGASEAHNYLYSIMAGQTLVFDENYYSDVPLKWEWVYDMLGYYFIGTVDKDAESKVIVDEYIRPIEYDYEQAVFDREEDSETYQQLLSVNDTTKEQFLTNVSSSDGYAGTIDFSKAVTIEVDGINYVYYPVETDAEGNGVWAYLCTLNEIEKGIEYDSQLASSTDKVTTKATIIITAFNVPTETKLVSTEDELLTALTSSDVDVIKLNNNVSVDSIIELSSDTDSVLNLNGYGLSYTGTETDYNMIKATEGSSLTIMNGELIGNGLGSTAESRSSVKSMAIQSTAADITLSNVIIRGFDGAVKVSDEGNTTGDTVLRVIGCDIETIGTSFLVKGNGENTETMTKFVVQDSTITSTEYIGISGQGNTGRWGVDCVITGSTITGKYAAIYYPQQQSTMFIDTCKLIGDTGLVVKGSSVTVLDTEITASGEYAEAKQTGGVLSTGDGVFMEASYNWAATVQLKGNTVVNSQNGYAVQLFGITDRGPGKMIIENGIYNGAKGSAYWNEIGTFEIYEGTYSGSVTETIKRYDVNE